MNHDGSKMIGHTFLIKKFISWSFLSYTQYVVQWTSKTVLQRSILPSYSGHTLKIEDVCSCETLVTSFHATQCQSKKTKI
jgi:hypothetical protein